MKYALVTFAFCGGFFTHKKYLFNTEVEDLKSGDLVIVEGVKKGTISVAFFVNYIDVDKKAGIKRKTLLCKATEVDIDVLIFKRYKEFESIQIPLTICNKYRTLFKDNEHLTDYEVRFNMIRNLVLAATYEKKETFARYSYGTMRITIKDNKVIKLEMAQNKKRWLLTNELKYRTALKLEELLYASL